MQSLATSLETIFRDQNAAVSRLSAILDGLAAANSTEKPNWRDSIIDLLKLLGMDSSLHQRQNLAGTLGFAGDVSGSAMMNIFLHNRIIMAIVQNHAVEVVATLDDLVARNSERLDWRDSIVDLMKLFGLKSHIDERKKLATGLGFTGELSGSGTMNMWLHTRLVIAIVDNGGKLPAKLPKKSAASRVQALCRATKIKEGILPAIAAVWDRHNTGKPSRNEFEAGIYAVFASLEPEQRKSMAFAFAGYGELRKDGTAECFFDDGLAKKVRDRPLEKAEFVAEFMREGVAFAGQQLFSGSGGVIGPGQVRPWRPPGGVPGESTTPLAPWPWLTAIRTDASSTNEFGNLESVRAVPPETGAVTPLDYQFAQACRFDPDASGGIVAHCERMHPPPAPPGGLFGGNCEGGPNYTFGNDCLRIPTQRAGGSIRLRGFNFITPTVKVHLQLKDHPPLPPQECVIWGDRETAVNDEQGRVITDLRVRDWVDVPIPSEDPARPGAPLAAGLYDVWISVIDPGTSGIPIVRESNRLLLRILPNENIHFLFRSDRGRCIKETPGGGDDEIWWDAFVGHLVANKVPLDVEGSIPFHVKDISRKPFPRAPWEDMDDGKPATYVCDVFGPGPFELNGVVAFAIVGFEIDSEAAARDQLQGFWNAFFEAFKKIADLAGAFGGPSAVAGLAEVFAKSGIQALATQALSAAIVAVFYLAVITLVTAGFWAVWAPADLIALDIFCLDAESAWDMTDSKRPLPGLTKREFGGEFDDNDVLIRVAQVPLPKLGNPGELVATWVQEHQYEARHDGDLFSRYALEFRLTRTSV